MFQAVRKRKLGQKRSQILDAIETFKLNVREHPNSANIYDSLGEEYFNNNPLEEATKNYKKSLKLDDDNENARVVLDALQQKREEK